MRLVIPKCHYCIRDRHECDHANTLRSALKALSAQGTVVHNCPIYARLIPVVDSYQDAADTFGYGRELKNLQQIIEEGKQLGARVKIMLKEVEHTIVGGGSCDYDPPEDKYEWIDVCESLGTVTAAPVGKKVFFEVTLDEPIELNVPEKKGDWSSAKPREVDKRWLPANKLEFVKEKAEVKRDV